MCSEPGDFATISWRVRDVNLDRFNTVSDTFVCHVSPRRRLAFKLRLVVRNHHDALDEDEDEDTPVCSLFLMGLDEDYDADVRFACKVATNNFVRTRPPAVVRMGGKDGKSRILFEDKLSLGFGVSHPDFVVTLNIFKDPPYPKPQFLKIPPEDIAVGSLSSDLGAAFDEETGADLTILCRERKFRVQRGLLAARNEVFAAMFASRGFREEEEGEVRIDDVSPGAMDKFLRFLYTDDVRLVRGEHTGELMAAADKYGVGRMKEACEQVRRQNNRFFPNGC